MKLLIAILLFAGFAQAATLTPVTTNIKPSVGYASISVWSAGATGDVGTAVAFPTYHNKVVQVTGTFGAGTVAMEGSINGTNYAPLLDAAGAAVSFTTTGIKQIATNARYIRPNISGGAASAMVITLLSSK